MEGKPSKKGWAVFNNSLGLISGLIVLGVALMIGFEVIMRYLFDSPTTWVTESSELIIVIIAFLSLGYTLYTDGHVAVTLLKEHLPVRWQNRLQVFTTIIAIIFTTILIWYGSVACIDSITDEEIYSMTFPIPLYPFKIFIPLGSVLLLIVLLVNLSGAVKKLTAADQEP